MTRPHFIALADWDRLTKRQKQTMIERGESHLNHMRAWLRASENPRGNKPEKKPGNRPKPSQWFNEPSEAPKAKDHQY